MASAKPNKMASTSRMSTFRWIRIRAVARNPMTATHDVWPQCSRREILGNASQSAAMTIPTFRQAPDHMFWLPAKNHRIPAAPSSTIAIVPTSVRLIVSGCDEGVLVMKVLTWLSVHVLSEVVLRFSCCSVSVSIAVKFDGEDISPRYFSCEIHMDSGFAACTLALG